MISSRAHVFGAVAGSSSFGGQNDGRQYTNYLFRSVNQRSELATRHCLRFCQQSEPIQTLPRFLLGNTELVGEVGAAFASLCLLDIRADGACGAKILLAQNPSNSIALFQQISINLDGPQRITK